MTAASDRGTETVRPEVADAAARAMWPRIDWDDRERFDASLQQVRDGIAAVLPLLTAADVPHIEAAVRGKVAQEIEAAEVTYTSGNWMFAPSVRDKAARIARGASS